MVPLGKTPSNFIFHLDKIPTNKISRYVFLSSEKLYHEIINKFLNNNELIQKVSTILEICKREFLHFLRNASKTLEMKFMANSF